jgi:hypothetical protein
MTPKGMYTVQKSRSFGGLRSSSSSGRQPHTADGPPDREPEEQQYHSGGGRRTPALGSLRRKFQLSRKAASTENNHYRIEDEDDGRLALAATPSWKKRHKLANLFRWFKKGGDSSNSNSGSNRELTTSLPADGSGLRPVGKNPRMVSLEARPAYALASVPEKPLPGRSLGGENRSLSLDSLCSVGSTASSFAFVPLDRCRGVLGSRIQLAPQKRTPQSRGCGPVTVQSVRPLSPVAMMGTVDLTLRTKYKLFPAEAGKQSVMMQKTNNIDSFDQDAEDSDNDYPTGTLLHPSAYINGPLRDIDDDDNDSDDTVLESVS